jgi:hypothetical protein
LQVVANAFISAFGQMHTQKLQPFHYPHNKST